MSTSTALRIVEDKTKGEDLKLHYFIRVKTVFTFGSCGGMTWEYFRTYLEAISDMQTIPKSQH